MDGGRDDSGKSAREAGGMGPELMRGMDRDGGEPGTMGRVGPMSWAEREGRGGCLSGEPAFPNFLRGVRGLVEERDLAVAGCGLLWEEG